MARSIFVNGWNIPVRLADFNFIEAARNGEVGTGGFNLDSENAGVSINSHWGVSARETSSPSNTYLFEGFVADLNIARGPYAIDKDRQYDVNFVDLNTMLIDDLITGSSGNRPEETDIARVTWLVGTSFLNGMGSTIGSSGATTLEAADFRTQNPLALLTQAAETSGKLFFVYYDISTNAPKLFYDLATASNFITASKISTFLADGSNPLTHHPRKASLHRQLDGGRIYSELLFKYDGGNVTVTNTATASNYKPRKTVIFDNNVKSAAQATRKANQYLNTVSTPEDVITLDVDLTAAQINEFRAGQLMQIKAPHLGLPTFVDRRIVRTERKPREASGPNDQEDYTVTMELSVPKSNRFGASGVPIESLPDEVTGSTPTPSEPAATECVSSSSLTHRAVSRQISRATGWVLEEELLSAPIGVDLGSWVYYNVPWTASGCPIGAGGWEGYHDREEWYEFTAPADDSSYLGLKVTIDASGAYSTGYVNGWRVGVVSGAAAATRYGESSGGLGGGSVGSIVEVYVPRSLVTWGATNSIVLHPDWECARSTFFCSPSAYWLFPVEDGRGASGRYHGITVGPVCAVKFVDGETGLSGEVAAFGDVDGVNRTFTLIGWDGTGTPELSMNGLEQPSVGVVYNRTTGTATLESAPPTGTVLLWDYPVGAITADITLTPEPVAIPIVPVDVAFPVTLVVYPDPVGIPIDLPAPTVTV